MQTYTHTHPHLFCIYSFWFGLLAFPEIMKEMKHKTLKKPTAAHNQCRTNQLNRVVIVVVQDRNMNLQSASLLFFCVGNLNGFLGIVSIFFCSFFFGRRQLKMKGEYGAQKLYNKLVERWHAVQRQHTVQEQAIFNA